ncbi:MAG: TIGR04282 family arsenosugar biosynthesis glycosyltransferase [Verrucomicrobia bacterium]|nr:TIGR04282 family arsenosugar biosynthesis glycosyltransferase [Verrucomicrobiota bacterium]
MNAKSSRTKLFIFLKAPRPGQVKTRLAASIGAEAAQRAYKTMVEHLLANLRGLTAVQLRFSPEDAEHELRAWLGRGFEYRWQGNGNLGERLQKAFQEGFEEGNERVTIIGSDCPYITSEDIEAAFESLKTNDVVLGPANDGGYWLIGLREVQACLFQDIPWSTEAVLETTLKRIVDARLSHQCLRSLSDIDNEKEWDGYYKTIPKPSGSVPG